MSSDKDEFWRRLEKFVADIETTVEASPQERAALRRSLGGDPSKIDDVRPIARRTVIPHLHPGESYTRERAFYTVASLIAAQPLADLSNGDDSEEGEDAAPAKNEEGERSDPLVKRTQPVQNLGSDIAGAALVRVEGSSPGDDALLVRGERDGKREDKRSAEEKRLHLLCRQDNDGIHRSMPGIARMLRSRGITPNWVRLTFDLSYWSGRGRDYVAKAWLDSFYRTVAVGQKKQQQNTDDETS